MAEKKQQTVKTEAEQPDVKNHAFEVKPNQTTSIVSGNDVLYMGKDVVRIIIETRGSEATSASVSAGSPRVPGARSVTGEDRGD